MAKNKSRFSVASAGFDYTAPDTIPETPIAKEQIKSETTKKTVTTVKKETPKEQKNEVQKNMVEISKTVKVGRPKGVPKTRVTVYLPTEMTDQLSGAMNIYKGDMAAYISKLISKDLEENGDLYKQISSLANI